MMQRCVCTFHNCKQIKGGTGVGWGKSGHYLVTDAFRRVFDLFQIYINPLELCRLYSQNPERKLAFFRHVSHGNF